MPANTQRMVNSKCRLADLHLDQYLTTLSVQFKNADYVATKLFPIVPVQKEHDKYITYDQSMLFNVTEDRRADGALANEFNWELGEPGILPLRGTRDPFVGNRPRTA